ncbi:glycine oxidase ThiO [Hoyosella sp. YIM 151337]|uniref:glycine oxidase ThiO n=1 Tax=Hoyosella sp. YIM 151337 TaxID=2992742 RepID=UPI002235A8FF|nr:glycine oxidase ThiO [Hoyosella sp. YIM 151337]MCW4351831.1 glycine oxidase ThiO [Hoyosella sp. YIM 151337]
MKDTQGTVAVAGGGVIGLSIAWRAATAGWRVTVYDPNPIERSTSWVAGGMLAPMTEGWPGEERLLELGVASLRRWDEFAAALADFGSSVVTAHSTITVAADEADVRDLHRVRDWLDQHNHCVTALTRAELRQAEPELARSLRPGFAVSDERAVDNRTLVRALAAACAAAGVRMTPHRVQNVASLHEDQVVVATGPWTSTLLSRMPVRPVKGEVLRLRKRPGSPDPPSATVRAVIHGRPVYLVPRPDGVVVGATQYEAGFDTQVTAGGVRDLLADAEIVFPGLSEYEFAEAIAGMRPMTPDNLPILGRLDERVTIAAGHGRGGILLAPLTADAVVAELAGAPLDETKYTDPRRFRNCHDKCDA